MIFAELTAEGWVLIIGAVFFGVQQTVKMVLDYFSAKRAAVEVKKVAVALADTVAATDAKLDSIAEAAVATDSKISDMADTGSATHALVNSAMLEQKRMHMVKCEAAAKDNPTAVNIAEAKASREAFEKHKDQQDSMGNG